MPFTFRFYLHSLTQLLGKPYAFFEALSRESGPGPSAGFLIVSALVSAAASTLYTPVSSPLTTYCIYFINSVGMTVISAFFGYIAMVMITGRTVTFGHLFSIYAFSSGTTLLASWMPYFLFITESWKWWLIGAGMIRSCKLSLWRTIIIISLSITIMVLFFFSIIPLISPN